MKRFSRTPLYLTLASAGLLAACSPVDRDSHSYEKPVNEHTFNHINAPEVQGGAAMLDPEYQASVKPGVLTARSLAFLYADRTSYGRHNARAGEWTEYTAKDGRAIYLNRYGEISDGTWWVSGNKICFAYGAQETASCNYVRPVGSYFQYEQEDGKKEFYVTKFATGDQAKLVERAAQIRQ